jgi:multidrug efflux system membrane fusion protein
LQAAHAAEMQAEGALKAAKLNIEFTHVLAPIAGRVSRHLVSVGNLVQGSEGNADAADLDRHARSDLHLFRRG